MAGPAASDSEQRDRAAAVETSLRDAGELGRGDAVVEISQMSGGWSRHSYSALVLRADGAEKEYVVRVEAPGGVLETEVATEYAVFAALDGEEIATPRVFGLEPGTENPFAAPYFVMEKVAGTAPNVFRAPDRALLEADWLGERGIARDMVENLARLHRRPIAGLSASIPRLDFVALVERWRDVHERYSLLRDPVVEEAFAWLAEREPPPRPAGLTHGDYRIGNALVDAGRVAAVLDWELAYVGDVRYDLGYISLQRLAGKHLRPVTGLFGAFAEDDWFFREYERLSGEAVDREVVRTFSVVGIMMLLGTIYMGTWMYRNGRTTDFRLAWARFGAPGLRQDLTDLMDW